MSDPGFDPYPPHDSLKAHKARQDYRNYESPVRATVR